MTQQVEKLEKDLELSQMSAWTGESIFNINDREREEIKKRKKKVLDEIYKVGLPDREELIDTIIGLR